MGNPGHAGEPRGTPVKDPAAPVAGQPRFGVIREPPAPNPVATFEPTVQAEHASHTGNRPAAAHGKAGRRDVEWDLRRLLGAAWVRRPTGTAR
jgi:hypothetical protein